MGHLKAFVKLRQLIIWRYQSRGQNMNASKSEQSGVEERVTVLNETGSALCGITRKTLRIFKITFLLSKQ
jgi:hypothetical protein